MKFYLDADYVRTHLREYIQLQLSQGYALADIKDALTRYGYEKDLIEHVSKGIDQSQYALKPGRQSNELDAELREYVQDLLVDYIGKQLTQGYTIEVIRKALLNYGHHQSMVSKAIKAVEEGKVDDLEGYNHWKMPSGILFAIGIVLLSGLIIYMSYVTGSDINKVALAFIPAVLAYFCSYAMLMLARPIQRYIPIAAVALTVGIFLVMLQIPSMVRMSSPNVILFMNAFSVFLLSSMLAFLAGEPVRVESAQEIVNEVETALKN
jgi:hypothetical protein